MTLITTQEDKAGPVLGPFLRKQMTPALNRRMQARGWPMVPYVYSKGQTPDKGIVGFLERPLQHRVRVALGHVGVHH